MQQHEQTHIGRPLGADIPRHDIDVLLRRFRVVAMPLCFADKPAELAADRNCEGPVPVQVLPPLLLQPRLQPFAVPFAAGDIGVPMRNLVGNVDGDFYVSPLGTTYRPSKSFNVCNCASRLPASILRMLSSFHCSAGIRSRFSMPRTLQSGSPAFMERRN